MSIDSVSASRASVSYSVTSANVKVSGSSVSVEASSTRVTAEAATFEHSAASGASYKPDRALVAQMKEELATMQTRFADTVRDMLAKQGVQIKAGQGAWKDYTVDPEVQAEAQKNISEDGYWGVKQTSDRIVKFAVALTGGDPSKLDAMLEAFEKGYAEAEKAWGGTLPDIAQQTREAVHQKFDDLKKQAGLLTE